MVYVVSDIHGCYDKYIMLLECLNMSEKDSLYVLGDTVDRGSGGIRILLDLAQRKNAFSYRGNHDHCALTFLRNFAGLAAPKHWKIWLDDMREAPEGYSHCHSVNEAKKKIMECEREYAVIDVIDCDHALGDYASDGGWMSRMDTSRYFLSVDSFKEISDGKHNFVLCHYPLMSWKHANKSYMIHGHIHNKKDADYWAVIKNNPRILNAGVDVNGFWPVSFDEMVINNDCFKEGLQIGDVTVGCR